MLPAPQKHVPGKTGLAVVDKCFVKRVASMSESCFQNCSPPALCSPYHSALPLTCHHPAMWPAGWRRSMHTGIRVRNISTRTNIQTHTHNYKHAAYTQTFTQTRVIHIQTPTHLLEHIHHMHTYISTHTNTRTHHMHMQSSNAAAVVVWRRSEWCMLCSTCMNHSSATLLPPAAAAAVWSSALTHTDSGDKATRQLCSQSFKLN